MNQKKKTKVLLITIICLCIVILLAGAVFTYFSTDIFKSNKELFYKYASKMLDNEKGLFDNTLKQYFQKRNTVPYNNQSEISFNISDSNNSQNFDSVNNFNITFSGQIDVANSKAYQDISLNYSDNVKFPIKYKQVSNVFGIQSKYFGSKFIAIKSDNLDNMTEDNQVIGEEVNDLGEIIKNISEIETNNEQTSNTADKYKEVINKELNEENFSKVNEGNLTGYKLTLDGEKCKNILIQLLETLKGDEEILEKLNQYIEDFNINYRYIDDIIDFIEEADFNDKSLEITIYKDGHSVKKLSIKIDTTLINIEKTSENDSQSFNFSIINNNTEIINVNATFQGLKSIQNVKENYEIKFNIESISSNYLMYNSDQETTDNIRTEYKYQIKNDVNFTDVSTIEDFSKDNTLVLTDYDSEEINDFIGKVLQRIDQVNEKQMEQLGLEKDQNPIILCIPSLNIFINTTNLLSNNILPNLSEEELKAFNQKFEVYEGTNQRGPTVKGLLSTITLNNDNNDSYKIKEINFEGEEYEATETNITFIKEDIDLSKNYRIEFEKDENTGIIFRVIINAR